MSARIFGTVKGADTGVAITNASVSAPPYSVTIVNGVYFFLTPGAATVAVTASAPNYVPQTVTVTVVNSQQKLQDFTLVHV